MKKSLYYYTSLFAWGVVFLLIVFYAFAWNPPVDNPPNANLPAPINTSSIEQTKAGNLNLGGLLRLGLLTSHPTGTNGAIYYNTTDNKFYGYQNNEWKELGSGGGASFWLASGNNIYNTNTGNVGIGTMEPGAKLEVSGNLKLSGETPTYKITNLATPTATSDAATKGYVDAAGGEGWACGLPITDPRDGKIYATVHIGFQCWLKQGLNIGTRINGANNQSNDSLIEKYCYGDNEVNCKTNNPNLPDGGLYQWAEAMALPSNCNSTDCSTQIQSPHQGICPEGWHIPTDAELCTLEQTVDPTIACDSTSWRGTDGGTKLKPNGLSGFEGNLAGYRDSDGTFYNRGSSGYFWSSSQDSATGAWRRLLSSSSATVYRNTGYKAYGFSVRCLKD